jgi:serine/threonine protein kinase
VPLQPGTRLGPYEISALLGAGGMGEVYRARDTRLDRVVAIKVLPPELAAAGSFRERFEREARLIAALSHPNICTLHDVGRQDGIDFLVMEYLDGETLAARLARQGSFGGSPGRRAPLPLDETLRIGTELADALAAAHRAGIVHRDLKPGNVILTKRGAKVLDFGLAKLGAGLAGDAHAHSATSTQPLTGSGALVGTLPYMAPEQLEGRDVDARTDIFALGSILYEMAAGRRPFSGESQASLIAAILDRDPEPISQIDEVTPPGMDRLVRKCLAKDPEARWQSASDIADELRWIASGSGTAVAATPGPVRGHPRSRVRLAWAAAIAVLALAAIGSVIVWLPRQTPVSPPSDARHVQASFDGNVLGAAISPDGHSVAYTATRSLDDFRIFVRDFAAGQPLEIWKGRGVQQIAWLPDGLRLVVSSSREGTGGLLIVPRLGGEPRPVAANVPYVAPSPDGSELAVSAWSAGGFRIISLDGEERSQGRVPLQGILQVEWTKDDRIAVVGVQKDGRWAVWTASRTGSDARAIHYSRDELLGLCSSPATGALYAIRQREQVADLLRLPASGRPDDPPQVLLSGLSLFETGFSIVNGCSVSADGNRLVYRRGVQYANLWRLALDGTAGGASPITRGTFLLGLPSVSPDGRWIAAARGTDLAARIVKVPAAGGEPIEITVGTNPVWSPDGRRLAFVSGRTQQMRVWYSDADGQSPREIPESGISNLHMTWLPDGRLAWPVPGARNYRIRDLATGREENLLTDESRGWLIRVRFSPLGDRLAAFWNRPTEGRGLWTLTWPGREPRFLALDLWPVGWSADGQWIYAHKHGDGVMLRVSPISGKAERVGAFPGMTQEGGCDLTPDRHAIVCSLLERHSDAWLVERFDPEVPRR